MISKEKLSKYMDKIKEFDKKEQDFDKVLSELSNGQSGYAFIYTDVITTMVEMLTSMCDLGDNDLLYYYCWDLNYGQDKMAENCIIDADKTFSLRNINELYDYILYLQEVKNESDKVN